MQKKLKYEDFYECDMTKFITFGIKTDICMEINYNRASGRATNAISLLLWHFADASFHSKYFLMINCDTSGNLESTSLQMAQKKLISGEWMN